MHTYMYIENTYTYGLCIVYIHVHREHLYLWIMYNAYIHVHREHLYLWIMYCIHACRVEGVVYVHMRVTPSMQQMLTCVAVSCVT